MDKKKMLKMIVLVVLTVIIVYSIYLIRNYIILSKIYEKQLEYSEVDNFSVKVEAYRPDGNTEREIYKKGSKSLMKYEEVTIWSDEETKEIIILTQEKKALINSSESIMQYSIPHFIQRKDDIMNLALISFVSYDKIDDEKCYVINWGGPKEYISIETGITLLSINGKVGTSDGKEYDNIQKYKDIKINEVTDEIVSRPDLSEYEVIYSN